MARLLIIFLLLLTGCATRTQAPVVDRSPIVPTPGMVAVPPPPAPNPPQTTTIAPTTAPATVEKDWRPEFYTVKRGETLYAIALEHGLDYRELAAMNYIENTNLIRVGQVLRLRAPDVASSSGVGPTSAPLISVPPVVDARPVPPARPPAERGNTDAYKAQPKAIKLPYSEAALAQLQSIAPRIDSAPPPAPTGSAALAPPAASPPAAPGMPPSPLAPAVPILPSAAAASSSTAPAPSPGTASAPPPAAAEVSDDRIDWGWPVRGKIISGFSETANLKGIDIGGAAGVPIIATAAGRVVYAGSGLRGYGKLVIVKHNKTYLSAYAHLDQISIREGQSVNKGQELGKMGNTDANQVKLHFEIRALGKPVDPLRYLPRG